MRAMPVRRAAALAACLALLGAPATAQAAGAYSCTTEDFMSFDRDDTAFAEKNLRKTFTLAPKGDAITLETRSPDFTDTTRRYVVVSRGLLDTVAVEEDMSVSFSTLVMPAQPDATIRREGHFNATLALQSQFYLNTWLLRCTG